MNFGDYARSSPHDARHREYYRPAPLTLPNTPGGESWALGITSPFLIFFAGVAGSVLRGGAQWGLSPICQSLSGSVAQYSP